MLIPRIASKCLSLIINYMNLCSVLYFRRSVCILKMGIASHNNEFMIS